MADPATQTAKTTVPTADREPGVTTIKLGNRVYRITGNPAFAAGVRLASMFSPQSAGAMLALQILNNNMLRAKTGATPLVARPGAMRQDANNQYGNRPIIRVMTKENVNTLGQPMVVGTFDDWILGEVQETDSEKIDVIETFGQPHLFVSGRFIRKYTFSGAVRATPVNARAGQSNGLDPKASAAAQSADLERQRKLRTSQYDLLRVFYDQYLRATEQASRGTYTEIVVDGQVYVGYIGTMNFHRAAETEGVVPFTFTMFGIARRGASDADAQALLALFDTTKRKSSRLTNLQAAAALSNAHGKVELTLTPGEINLGLLTPDKPNGEPKSAQIVAKLTAKGDPQRLKVRGPRGAVLVYRANAAAKYVDNTVCALGEESIGIEVTDYFRLYQDLFGTAATPEERQIPSDKGIFTITADCGTSVQIRMKGVMKGQAKVVLTSVTGFINEKPLPGAFQGGDVKDITLGELTNVDVFTDENKVPVELKFKLAYPDKTPLPSTLLTKAAVEIGLVGGHPVVGKEHKMSDHPGDKGVVEASQSADAQITSIVGDTISVRFNLGVRINPADHKLNDKEYSPLTFANRIDFRMVPKITVPGMAALETPKISFAVIFPTKAMRSIFGPVTAYAPSSIQTLKGGGKSVTFTISFPRAEGVSDPIDGSVQDAVKAMNMNLLVLLPGWWDPVEAGMTISLLAPSPQSIAAKVPVTATPRVWVVDTTTFVEVVFSSAKEPEDMLTFIHFAQKLADPKKVALIPPPGSPIRGPYSYVKIVT